MSTRLLCLFQYWLNLLFNFLFYTISCTPGHSGDLCDQRKLYLMLAPLSHPLLPLFCASSTVAVCEGGCGHGTCTNPGECRYKSTTSLILLYDTHNICLLTAVGRDLEGRAVMKVS